MNGFERSFFFVRHAETDHNKYRISGDDIDVDINENGEKQAGELAEKVRDLNITHLYISPMTRVKSTCDILFEGRYESIDSKVLKEFTECSHGIWSALAEWSGDIADLTEDVSDFLQRVKTGFAKISQPKEGALVLAHGGIFWALCYHLEIDQDRNIDNCVLVRFSQDNSGVWRYSYE
jgi:broad specificity phosphatase PhoE